MSSEIATRFTCAGETLTGVLHFPERYGPVGVVVVVGGPQYRVGSHRQFVLLARHLAASGHAVLRFDCRGMGDSSGEFPGFEHIGEDIRAAIDELLARAPRLRRVALWGLCDAASAALMYAGTDTRVAGLVLLNPWARTETTLARAYLRNYYLRRLVSRDFWRKLLSGGLSPKTVAADLADNLRAGSRSTDERDFITRMREGLRQFAGPVLLILSGNDITAAEFRDLAAQEPWRQLLDRPTIERHPMPEANHTFSTARWRDEVAGLTAQWLKRLGGVTATS
jgi:exosortase A-associated hydrolase 1